MAPMFSVGIPLIAYSPVGRGWLTGQFRTPDDIPKEDFRRMLPRFQPEVFGQNLKLVEEIEGIAKRKGVTVAQIAIAWVRLQGAIPIPGSTKIERVIENCEDISLSEEDLVDIQNRLNNFPVLGGRYPKQVEARVK